MLGTFINAGAILIGSIVGNLLQQGLKEKYETTLYNAMGLAATGLGMHAVITNISKSAYPVLFIISLAIGGILGTAIDIDTRFNKLVGKHSKSNLGEGLATAIILFCLGTLSILGPIESALNQNHTYLFTNATLDLVTSLVLSSTYGIGIAFSAPILFVWQGLIFLLAYQIATFLVPELMIEISIIGGFLIFASGLSILKIKSIRTLNLMPALLIPIVWFLFLIIL